MAQAMIHAPATEPAAAAPTSPATR